MQSEGFILDYMNYIKIILFEQMNNLIMDRILQRILGLIFDNGIWKLRSNKEVYEKKEKIEDSLRKRRASLIFGHIKRMSKERPTKIYFFYYYFDKTPKPQVTWFQEVKKELTEISENIISDGILFRQKIQGFQGFVVHSRANLIKKIKKSDVL